METVVVLAGLMLIVPHYTPVCASDPSAPNCRLTSLTALVLDTNNACPQLGEQVRPHQRDIVNLDGLGKAPLSGIWTLTASPDKITFVDPEPQRLLFLDRGRPGPYKPGELSSVREVCLGDTFSDSCLVGGHRLVAAQIRFEGGWEVRPIEISESRQPVAQYLDNAVLKELHDDAVWDFTRVRDGQLPVVTSFERTLAGGVLFRPKNHGAISIQGPNADQFKNLALITADNCNKEIGVATDCSILRFLNAMTLKDCALGSGDRLEVDTHHNIIYELFQPVPVNRYLLFLRKSSSQAVQDILFPSGGGSVGCRPCVPPMFSSPSFDGK